MKLMKSAASCIHNNKNERNSGGQSNEPVKSISLRCIKKAFSGKGYSNQILGRSSQLFQGAHKEVF